MSVQPSTDWLNEPQFIASYDFGDEVIVFFREVAKEYTNCGKKIYSRVARVCKEDTGSTGSYADGKWTSFHKARLNCSIPGSYPYYFDEVQDVYSNDSETFYVLFTTNNNGLTASAICIFTKEAILAAFNGPYKQQKDVNSNWLPVPDKDVPARLKPFQCSTPSNSYSDRELNFLRAHPIMDKAVEKQYGRPVFYKANCLMQKLAMEEVLDTVPNRNSLVFYTGTNQGEVYKILVRLPKTKEPPQWTISTTLFPFPNGDSIWALKKHGHYLYLGSDMSIKQVDTRTCEKYGMIDVCIMDPDCKWIADKGLCCQRDENPDRPALTHEIIQDLTDVQGITADIVNKLDPASGPEITTPESKNISVGMTFILQVNYKLCIRGPVTWMLKAGSSGEWTEIEMTDKKVLSVDNSLLIKYFNKTDEGYYKATDKLDRTVAFYKVDITDMDDLWERKFTQWCEEFDNFRRQRETCASKQCCNCGG